MNYFFTWLELNSFFDQYDSKSRIFHKKWLKVLNTFLNLTERVESFLHWTQRIELFFQPFDSKNWAFFYICPKLKKFFFLKKKTSQKMTQRIGPKFLTQRYVFLYGSKNFFLYDSKNWFFCMTQRIKTFFFEYDAENWNLFLWIWRRELMPFSFLPQRIETFSSLPQMIEFFSKILTQRIELFFLIWLKEMKSEKKKTQRVELFFCMTYRIEPLLFSLIWFKELNFVSKKETLKKSKSSFSTITQRIELFVNDS